MVIFSTFADNAGEYNSSRYRTLEPAEVLNTAGHTVYLRHIASWMFDDPQANVELAKSDLIIVQRVMAEESAKQAKFWRERKKAIVVDFDDAYQLIDESNAAHKFWGRGEVEIEGPYKVKYEKILDQHPLQQFIGGVLNYCVGGTMPGKMLKKTWEKQFPCWYIPNFVNTDRYLKFDLSQAKDPDWITLSYGGSLSHVPSFKLSGVEQALKRVIKQRKNVRVLICGDKRVYDRLQIPPNKKMYLNYVVWRDWPKIVAKFDIAIAPMVGLYDRSRSWIKLMEAGLMRLPVVATSCEPYSEWEEAGFGLYVPEGEDEAGIEERSEHWEKALLETIDHIEDYREVMKNARDFTIELCDSRRNVNFIIRQYEDIISRA